MWSFLIALFGGLYLCGKYSIDKGKAIAYKSKYDREKTEADTFYQKFDTPCSECKRIQKMILGLAPEIEELEEELYKEIGMKPTHPMLIWGFLAKQGKIPNLLFSSSYHDADNPLSNEHDLIWSNITVWKEIDIKDFRAARLKFLLWYDKELRSHGMEYQLMYAPAHYKTMGKKTWEFQVPYYSMSDRNPITECKDLCPTMVRAGERDTYPVVVFWEPTKHYVHKLVD